MLRDLPAVIIITVLLAALLMILCGCAAPANANQTQQAPTAAPEIKAAANAKVSSEVNQSARNQAEQNSQGTKLDGVKGEAVTVNTTYGALDQTLVKLAIIGGLVFLGLLLGAAAAPGPGEAQVTLGLYIAAAACFGVALYLIWSFFAATA